MLCAIVGECDVPEFSTEGGLTMSEIYVKLDDVLAKKQFAYYLKQYVVTENDILKAEKIEYVPDETVEQLENAVKMLSNRCAVQGSGLLCDFCDIRDLCDKYRTVFNGRADDERTN